ncbi:MAG: hypothetical protein P1Q69_18130 [Candidatus Thorarchaeota archaeon]|nr:hypothetical protein [Candidatus Thorarchaeota archaeon]
MVKYGKRILLTTIALITLLGPLIVSAQAAMLPMRVEVYQNDFVSDSNGNTYVSFEGKDAWNQNPMYLDQDEDVNYDRFPYERTVWFWGTGSYAGPAYRRENIGTSLTQSNWGWLDVGHALNEFYIFENTTNEYSLGLDEQRVVFPLSIGVESTLLMESGMSYYGSFNVTDEEFFHLTIGSYQDDVEFGIGVIDPDGRWLAEWYLGDGNIDVWPFKPTGNGTYFVYINYYNYDNDAALVKLLLESVEPMALALGDMAEGVLEGSEVFIGADSSVVHREKAPHAVTYKVSTNSTTAGIVRSFFNLPEITPLSTDMYEPWIFVTSDAYYDQVIDYAWMYGFGYYTDAFHYQSFANETYYLTVLGMDETSYVLTNSMAYAPDLPLNEIFYIENHMAAEKQFLYTLNLGQDSVLKVNSTETGDGFDWELWTIDGNKAVWDISLSDNSAFSSATTYYIPAGNYLVLADAGSSNAEGWYNFNLGPVLQGEGAVSVDVGSIIGMRVATDPMTFYRMNQTLTTHDNVTVATDVDILNHLGGSIRGATTTLGTRQDGVYWHAFGANMTSWELGTSSTSYSMFTDEFAIITFAPYQAQNNTAGLVSDWYNEYTCDFEMTFYEDGDTYVNGTSQVNVGSSPVWNNVTLGDPGDNNERYVMEISCSADTWFNFSVYVEDVDSFTAYAYQDVEGLSQRLTWDSLNDLLTGSTGSEASFQFGSISPNMLLVFEIDRTQVEEGRLDVLITPFVTNDYVYAPQVEYFGGETGAGSTSTPLVIDPLLVVGGIAIVAVVVVVAVYARKTGRI